MKDLIKFRLQDISQYRSDLMGWSILWIMMLHFTFTQIAPMGFVAQYGFAGVEIFMFVSGLGLYYSLDKDARLLPFYRKRLLRIFPTYYLIGIFTSLLVFHDSVGQYLFRYSTIGFWTDGTYFEWYIPSIIVLYLVAPLLRHFARPPLLRLAPVLAAAVLVAAYLLVERADMVDNDHYFLLYRVPAFLLGMVCAYRLKQGLDARFFYILMLLGLPLFVWLFPQHHAVYRYKYLSVFFLMPAFIVSFVTMSKLLPVVRPVISRMGAASLEIYLIQQTFFFAVINGRLPVSPAWHDAVTLLLMVVSTLLGLLVHRLLGRLGL